MSNTQHKREDAAEHNARYELEQYRKKNSLPEWFDEARIRQHMKWSTLEPEATKHE